MITRVRADPPGGPGCRAPQLAVAHRPPPRWTWTRPGPRRWDRWMPLRRRPSPIAAIDPPTFLRRAPSPRGRSWTGWPGPAPQQKLEAEDSGSRTLRQRVQVREDLDRRIHGQQAIRETRTRCQEEQARVDVRIDVIEPGLGGAEGDLPVEHGKGPGPSGPASVDLPAQFLGVAPRCHATPRLSKSLSVAGSRTSV